MRRDSVMLELQHASALLCLERAMSLQPIDLIYLPLDSNIRFQQPQVTQTPWSLCANIDKMTVVLFIIPWKQKCSTSLFSTATKLKLDCRRRLQGQKQGHETHPIPVKSVSAVLPLSCRLWGLMEFFFVLRVELSPVRTRGCTDLGHLCLGVSEVSKSRHWHGNKKLVETNLKGKQWWGQKSQGADVFFPYPLRRTVLLLIHYHGLLASEQFTQSNGNTSVRQNKEFVGGGFSQ